MAARKSKPKRCKAYRPKEVRGDIVRLAKQTSAVLDKGEQQFLMKPLRDAYEALRTGACTREHWELMADAANIGVELADIGICSDAPSRSIIEAMQLALAAVCMRVKAGRGFTATGPELNAIKEGIDRHGIQLMFTIGKDLKVAGARLEQLKAQARAGRVAAVSLGAQAA